MFGTRTSVNQHCARSAVARTALAALISFSLLPLAPPAAVHAQAQLPSIADKTAGMQEIASFFPLYWDDEAGQLWMEIPRLNRTPLTMRSWCATSRGS